MDAKIFRVNYKSDFILTLISDAGWMTPFCIKFWTGAPSQAYYAQYDGTTYTNCAPVAGEPTKLTVQFDDHHMPIGNLKYQVAYHFTVADFPNDTEDEVLNQANITTEIDGETYQVMLDFTGETAPEIQFSLPAYANEAQRIANELQREANELQREANEEDREDNELNRQRNEGTRIENERERVQEFQQMKGELEQATRDASAAAENANGKAVYAKNQGDYAKQQGDYAKDQGDIAKADHLRAEEDHRVAGEDHTQAGNDHTRAGEDHTQAGNDHTRAGEDHTQAGNDHTRAGEDHTRAESDHAAVEVYVDSLGVFDLSKHNAVGGVLATYADLNAALTALNALESKYKYGGMSLKYVQSSDNKYVQYRLMAQNFTTDVTQWQGVDDEPTAGSDNLVKSGGVFDIVGDFEKDKTSYDDAENYKTGYWRDGIFVSSNTHKTITVPVEPQKLLVVFAYIWGTQANIMTKVTEDGTYISVIEKSKGSLTNYLFANDTDEIQYVDVSFDSGAQHGITTSYTISSILNTLRNYPEFIKLSENEKFCLALLDKDGRVLTAYKIDGTEISYGDKIIYGKIHNKEIDKINNDIDKINDDIDKINNTVCSNDSDEFQDIVIALLDKDKKVMAYFDKQADCHFTGNVFAPNLDDNRDNKDFDIISLHPFSTVGTVLHNMKRGSKDRETYPPLQLLHFSDLHGDADSLKRIIEFYNYYSEYIDDVLHTGDVMNSTYENDWSFWDAANAGFILNVNGNHDRWTGNVVASHVKPWIDYMNGYSQKQGYERYILPYKELWGIVDVPDKMYYYKDYAENNIRMIVLDNYNWKGVELKPMICDDVTATEKTYHESTTYPDGESVDNGEQLLWFEGVLEDARQNNLNVICACHAPLSTRTNIDCSFQTLIPTANSGLSAEAVVAVDTFIEQGGNFICWFAGHTHCDYFAKIGINNQLIVNVDSANYSRGFGINCKDKDSISRDCFNIINVNTTRGFVTLKRIGVEYDAFGRHIGEITYDYVNKNVLFNN